MNVYVEKEKVPYKKVAKITGFEYLEEDKRLKLDTLLVMINDLLCEYDALYEEFDDFKIKLQEKEEVDVYEDYILYQDRR